MSTKEYVGTSKGVIYKESNKTSGAPQDFPEDAWFVTLHLQSREVQKEYNATNLGWAPDNTFKIQVIEW